MCSFNVASCPSSLWSSKWWRRFLHLFYFWSPCTVDSVGVRPYRNVWTQSYLLLLRSCLSSCVTVLSNHLLSHVSTQCQPLRVYGVFFFLWFCCLTSTEQLYVLIVLCVVVVFQPAHCSVSENLTAASLSSSVLGETFKVNLSLRKCLKSSQFVCLLLKLGCFS
jgi:hypothetical protein